MRKLLLALALLLAPASAFAQCTGIFQPNTFCGNNTGTSQPPFQVPASSNVSGPGTTTINDLVLWNNVTGSLLKDQAPGAFTATNDTNVTMTLGGASSISLVNAMSVTLGWTGTLAAPRLNSNVVQAFTNDTNVTASIAAQNATLGWTGTLAAARLNANVVQAFTNDTNITASITAQNATLAWAGQLALARGGCAGTDQPSCLINVMPTPTRTGDIVYWNGSSWQPFAGNNSGTQVFSENSSGLPSWITVSGTGTVTQIVAQAGITGGTIVSTGTITSDPSYQGYALQNCTINASVGSNLLTVSLKDNAGNDPSAASPCNINFMNASGGGGSPLIGSTTSISIATAISISTFATGATLGSVNSTGFRFWVEVFNNAGTAVLALFNASTATTIKPLNESLPASSIAISGSATSAGVFYTPNGTTLANKSFRIAGYIEYNATGLVTAGTYATAPNFAQVFGAGVRKPGQVVQTQQFSTSSGATNATANYVATNLASNMVATSAANLIKISWSTVITQSLAATTATASMHRGNAACTTQIGPIVGTGSGSAGSFNAEAGGPFLDLPNTTAANYTLCQKASSGSVTIPSAGSNAFLLLEEIMG